MIGRLRGQLVHKRPPLLMVDVGGVGYEIEAPLSVFFDLPQDGEPITILTHLMVKEDSHTLYGFADDSQRELFRNLLKVSGVGAKLALAILSGVSVSEFVNLVNNNDPASLTKLPGIGKKTAERLIIEMRDRLPEGVTSSVSLPGAPAAPLDAASEASAALRNLGYKPAEVSRMVQQAQSDADETLSAEDIIRQALKSQVAG
ncbi:MAG: Holliday junction branch migration protein RuvA [Pseudomonadota bacterium]